MDKAQKFDGQKADLSLLPQGSLEAEARAFMYGQAKYGRWNYHKGMEAGRLVAAALRHILAWYWSEDDDTESGVNHLGHAKANLSMLLEQQRAGTMIDDRPPRPQPKPKLVKEQSND